MHVSMARVCTRRRERADSVSSLLFSDRSTERAIQSASRRTASGLELTSYIGRLLVSQRDSQSELDGRRNGWMAESSVGMLASAGVPPGGGGRGVRGSSAEGIRRDEVGLIHAIHTCVTLVAQRAESMKRLRSTAI